MNNINGAATEFKKALDVVWERVYIDNKVDQWLEEMLESEFQCEAGEFQMQGEGWTGFWEWKMVGSGPGPDKWKVSEQVDQRRVGSELSWKEAVRKSVLDLYPPGIRQSGVWP